MEGFPQILCDNIPGVSLFEFIPVDDVESVSEPNGMEVTVTLKTGKAWLKGFSSEKLAYNEEAEESDEGDSYLVKMSGFVPGDSKDLLSYFAELKQNRFLIKVKDLNGELRLMGSIDIGSRFSYSNKKDNENNGYSFVFSAFHPDLPPFFIA